MAPAQLGALQVHLSQAADGGEEGDADLWWTRDPGEEELRLLRHEVTQHGEELAVDLVSIYTRPLCACSNSDDADPAVQSPLSAITSSSSERAAVVDEAAPRRLLLPGAGGRRDGRGPGGLLLLQGHRGVHLPQHLPHDVDVAVLARPHLLPQVPKPSCRPEAEAGRDGEPYLLGRHRGSVHAHLRFLADRSLSTLLGNL